MPGPSERPSFPFAADTAERIRSGDARSFEHVYLSLYEPLYKYAYSLLHARAGAQESAEDAVQEVFRRVWERRAELPGTEEIRSYLFASVRNRIYKDLRHARITDEAAEKFDDVPALGSAGGDPEADLHSAELRTTLEHAIASVPENRREIITLRWKLGLSYQEISRTLGISVEAAQAQVSRVQRALRPLLKGLLG